MNKDTGLEEIIRAVVGMAVPATKLPEVRSLLEKLQKMDTTLVSGEVGKLVADLPLLISVLKMIPFAVGTIFNTLKVVVDLLQRITPKTFDDIISLVIKDVDFDAINETLKGVPEMEVKLLKPILVGVISSLNAENIGKIVNSTVKLVIDTIREDPTIVSRYISAIDIGKIVSDLFQVLPQLIPPIASLLPQLILSILGSLRSSLKRS
ncbi:MAG: hypothetical protein EF807_05865 [Candidatus Methanolliviera hydrocarbonicum]|uniref:Uncharacterized protein n=1 Tax=Candidatus Methanolliviera hydrocarbonicum TaxID=2491085 RepID=A0A520KVW4_9EURY|nr:MAG: hypothetical protein EF807_05865 [Candidatus Methanolliviera hydrocarbonicum]